MKQEIKDAINVLWAESMRLNSGAAYEATHQVLKLLEEAEANLDDDNPPKIEIVCIL